MQRTLWILTAVTGLAGAMAMAAEPPMVVLASGERVRGHSLTADADGTLKLQLEQGGPVQTYRRGAYRYATVPKPPEVEALEKAYDGGKRDVVLKEAGPIFEKYKYLGWGDHVAALEAVALVDLKKYDDAKRAVERGQRFALRFQDELVRASVLVMIGLGQKAEAKPVLDKLIQSADETTAAFVFNTRGAILTDEGKKKEAVLEYLKTLLLFEPQKVRRERDEARVRAVALLKEMNDARWKDIEAIK